MIPSTARALVAGLADGSLTSEALTEHFLARIAAENPRVHAVCRVEAERARREARASDARRRSGAPLGPLDGLPMTLKDAMRVQDSVTTWGLWLYRNHVPKTSARVAQILLDQGVVLLGRTAVPTGSFDWNCFNRVYAECVNPFDPTRTPGGSSGGAAAALATGMTPLEVGSDLGGSIRFPAHCCGVYGLRTTDDWLPVVDAGPEGLPRGYERLVTFGPMARTLDDLDLLLAAFDAALPLPASAPYTPGVAWTRRWMGLDVDDVTRAAFEAILSRATVPVVEAAPDLDPDALFHDWGLIAGFEYARGLPAIVRIAPVRRAHAWLDIIQRLGDSPFTRCVTRGMSASAAAYDAALVRREAVHATMEAFLARHGLWLLPNAASAAIPLALSARPVPTPQGPVPYAHWVGAWHAPTALLGTPALSFPIGADGALPIGAQVHGQRFSDRLLAGRAQAALGL